MNGDVINRGWINHPGDSGDCPRSPNPFKWPLALLRFTNLAHWADPRLAG